MIASSRCEQDKFNWSISVLVQKAGNLTQISQEMVEILAADIANPKKAAEFRYRLLS